jgi:hypothetical protein
MCLILVIKLFYFTRNALIYYLKHSRRCYSHSLYAKTNTNKHGECEVEFDCKYDVYKYVWTRHAQYLEENVIGLLTEL